MDEVTKQQRDARWTYIGQDTWLLKISPGRYVIRSTYRTMNGCSMQLICIECWDNVFDYLNLTGDS
jgi:hypothetical protein